MKKILGKSAFPVFLLGLLFLALSNNVFAQDLDDVTITGKVADANGAAIVGASVTATLITTGAERTVVTDEDGRYRIVELKPGAYSVKAEMQNFAAQTKTDLVTVAGQNVQLNFTLQPGAVTAEQTVSLGGDDALAVDTTRTVVGGTVTEREVEELPNNTRNPIDLVFTLSGVAEEPLSTRDLAEDKGFRGEAAPGNTPAEAGIFSLSGGAAYSNNITIDGLDNNDDRAATFRFQPSTEAVAELQVITNQFSAEYGRASGGRVNLRTRAGTKNFRGRFAYFFRDESLNANTWRNNSRGISRPALQENNPVVTFGGPIPFGYFKNKTFFFTAYEYQNLKENTVVDTYVPLAQNSRFPLPAPTNPNAAVGNIAPYVEAVPTPLKNHIFQTRIDHNFTDTNTIFFIYQFGKRDDFRQFSGGSRLAEALIGNSRDTHAFSASHNYVFNANLVNQARFQYSTLKPQVISDTTLTAPVVLVSLPAVFDRGASTLIAGSSTTGSSDREETRFQFQDTVNYVRGDHAFRFGVDVQRVKSIFIDRGDATGTFNFTSPAEFLANNISRYRHNFNTSSTQKNTYSGVFFQDEWRLRQNFTLSYGLRYENETIIDDKNNFGPRFAIAYAPFKDNKGVVRFGAGIFYNRALLRTIDDFTLTTNSLVFDTNAVPSGATRTAVLNNLIQRFPQPLTQEEAQQICQQNNLPCGNTAFGRRLDPDLKIPESYQMNVGFERELGNAVVFEANYTWNKTVRLWREFNANAISLAKLNALTGGNFKNFTEYLLSRDFPNLPGANGSRPFFGGTSTAAANFIRFTLTPYSNTIPGAQSALGTTTNPNPDLGGIVCINGAASCANATGNPNQNRYYLINLNSVTTTNTGAPIAAALAILNQFRPDPTRTQIEQLASIGNSMYNGLTLELRRRYRKLGYGFGTSLRIGYTLSLLKDDGIVNTSSAQIVGDFASEWSRSLQDRRHRFVLSGVFDTPWWFGKLRFSPLLRLASSAPFNLSGGGVDRNLDDVNTDRPNFNGDPDIIRYRNPGEPFPTDIFNALSLPTIGSIGGNLGRNAGEGPGLFLFDMNVSRQFKFGERFVLRPNIEINNVFNARVFSFRTAFINATDPQTTFLVPGFTYRPRQIRLGLRFDF
jgi:hypothetical protein